MQLSYQLLKNNDKNNLSFNNIKLNKIKFTIKLDQHKALHYQYRILQYILQYTNIS